MNRTPVCPDCGRENVPLLHSGQVQRHRPAIVTAAGTILGEQECTARNVKPEWLRAPTATGLTPTFSHPRKTR